MRNKAALRGITASVILASAPKQHVYIKVTAASGGRSSYDGARQVVGRRGRGGWVCQEKLDLAWKTTG